MRQDSNVGENHRERSEFFVLRFDKEPGTRHEEPMKECGK
jgi:hypothetical protein